MSELVIDPDQFPRTAAAFQYAEEVLIGTIPACRWVILACQRHKRDSERSGAESWPFEFDAAKAEKAINFSELMPHIKGKWAAQGKKLALEP